MTYLPDFLLLVHDLDQMMQNFSHYKKDLGYGYRRTFSHNGQRFDLLDYKDPSHSVLRLGRGAWFVRQYPVLHGLFDEVLKVVAKITIHDRGVFDQKHILGLLELLDQAPKGIGAFD